MVLSIFNVQIHALLPFCFFQYLFTVRFKLCILGQNTKMAFCVFLRAFVQTQDIHLTLIE